MKESKLAMAPWYEADTQRMVAMFAAQLDDQSRKLKKAIDGLSVEELEWQMHPGMNTIGMLLAHIAVAETFWIGVAPAEIPDKAEWDKIIRKIIGISGDDDGLPLAAEGYHPESLAGKTLEDYLDMLDNCRAATHKVLQTWHDANLDNMYKIEDHHISRSWTLYHVLEHLSGHLGQILMLKHIMRDQGVPTASL